ncbi:hypothetical protein [Georgenia sp. SYP-B2076]|uniref:hypothetical protein n=1 Tax=Georgenia sp. SYP-B2076 TaxID=2495881 RepID=UPI000F8CF604|nr:hypothetical protein [Georgenia sp. SYP-B2076]
MRYGPGPSWMVSLGEPHDLFFALYVRDALTIVDGDDFPPLAPVVPLWKPAGWSGAQRAALADQWHGWWAALIANRPETRPGGPDFGSTRGTELRDVQRELFHPARRWRAEHPSPPRRTNANVPPPLLVTRLVQDIERALGRRAAPFRYVVESIPTAGRRYWDLSPAGLLVSEDLLADADGLRDVLRPRLTALA